MNKVFSDLAWQDYTSWLIEDKKILKRINTLLKDIDRNGNIGLGKPEPLRYNLRGYWSRRITDEHRLIYKIEDNEILIVACKGHYN